MSGKKENIFNQKMVDSIRAYKATTGLTIAEIQNNYKKEAIKLDETLEGELKISDTFLSDLINGKFITPPKFEYSLSRFFQLGEDEDNLVCLSLMERYPFPVNQYMADGYVKGMDKHYKDRWNVVLNKMSSKSKYYYGFEMLSGEIYEIKHGDLTSSTPFLIETDKVKKTQSPCSDAEFIEAMKTGVRTRTICIKRNKEGKEVKQYNMYKLTSKNVKKLVRINSHSKQVIEGWELP